MTAGEALPLLIATRAVIGTAAVVIAALTVASIAGAMKQRPTGAGDFLARIAGAAILLSIPVAIAVFVGLLASALLIALGVPPITYVFILFAALISFRAAVRHPDYGMEGCTKMFGLMWSGYAVMWSAVSFEATGGLQSFDSEAGSLRWLQPPLAALPFALAVLKVSSKKKRNVWLFLGFWAFLAALMALLFFPVERSFASAVLPRSDWLRFPLTALAFVALLGLVRLCFLLRAKPNIRRTRIRQLKTNSRIMAAIFVAMGLSWAAARALVGALV